MSDARRYLLDRFTDDARTLRARAAALQAAAQPSPGPDAATSGRMADACDQVVKLISAIPQDSPREIMLQSLEALTLPLEQKARETNLPPVRSVYAGAATRIRELLTLEARAAGDEGLPTS